MINTTFRVLIVFDKAADRPSLKSNPVEEPAQPTLPANFGEVVHGIYRSSYPNPRNLPALEKLGLKTIM